MKMEGLPSSPKGAVEWIGGRWNEAVNVSLISNLYAVSLSFCVIPWQVILETCTAASFVLSLDWLDIDFHEF